MGKRNTEWLKARRVWVKNNPPDHTGYYVCGICGLPVHFSDMEVRYGQRTISMLSWQYEVYTTHKK